MIGKETTLHTATVFVAVCVLLTPGCGNGQEVMELRHFALDSRQGLITTSYVTTDSTVKVEGAGSLRIEAASPTRVLLFETGDIDVEDARLIYRARLRTDDLDGQAYLEMWCAFDQMGEFFSRALQAPLSGTNDWATQETSFFLEAGQNPGNVKLNLVVDGVGTVWVDDVRLLRGPLSP
ncbi:MAG TPA: hypothetical protein VFG78_11325 [Gemmatimonadota bacterium]|nr:hypothetical protein [Gemmatimonadota bacterium]